jgi:hypothetical protein
MARICDGAVAVARMLAGPHTPETHSVAMELPARVARLACLGCAVLAACTLERAPAGRPGGAAASPSVDSAASAEVYAALRLYYTRLTSRDWKVLATSFWPRSTITTIMRPAADTADQVHTISIEAFVARAGAVPDCQVSFSDEIARANVVTYGPLADAWVTYRARCGVSRDSVALHYGIDAFHLMQHHGEWRIANLTFTMEVAGEPLRQP